MVPLNFIFQTGLRPGIYFTLGASLLLLIGQKMSAQTVSTVREAEFRSRWTDYQVDKTKAREKEKPKESNSTVDYIAQFTQFGPLEFHGGLTTGWEYSNEPSRVNAQKTPSKSSLFLAPSLIAVYEKELGSWNIDARYSVGWLYYLDPDYTGSNREVTTSQSANLSLLRMNDRITIRSTTNASSGTGFDIERGAATDRVSVSESFSAEYQLSEYLRSGVSGSFGYDTYSNPGNAQNSEDTTNYRYAGAVFVDNFWTEKTAYRFELSAGSEIQGNSGNNSNDRTYGQGVLRVNYGPTSKLAFTGSVGLGVRNRSQENDRSKNGLRTVYSLSTTYTPSEKTSVRLYVGVEGASSLPELTLAVNWHPREYTFFELSVYQQTGLSNFNSTDERVSKGFLASFRQRLFGRLETSISGGYEQTASIVNNSIANEEDPYTFVAVALGWKINSYLDWQAQIRSSTGRNNFNTNNNSEQTRASMSLSLTY